VASVSPDEALDLLSQVRWFDSSNAYLFDLDEWPPDVATDLRTFLADLDGELDHRRRYPHIPRRSREEV